MHEEYGNGNGNWDSDKYEVNLNGYSVEYLVDLVQKYLVDNPDAFLDYEDYENEFTNELSKCASAEDVDECIKQFTGWKEHDVWKKLDYSKCATTQEQLDSASIWDEDLNWLIGWLTDHTLPVWSDEYIDKLRNSLELLRPEVPIGVFSVESEDEWYRQKNKERFTDARAYSKAQVFIYKSIFSWIYQNPNLIDLNGKSLGKSVKEIFDNIEKE